MGHTEEWLEFDRLSGKVHTQGDPVRKGGVRLEGRFGHVVVMGGTVIFPFGVVGVDLGGGPPQEAQTETLARK